ncbi:MAG TPA: amidohydrolase [Syntrophomonas sp.]|nr:amidohydrolase [Syntrophomonas sp.]
MQQDALVAVVQMASALGEIEENAGTIVELTHEAVKSGAQFILFPEMALQGYSYKNLDTLAVTVDDPVIRQLSNTACNLEVTLLVGFAERSDDTTRPYISQLIAFPDGNTKVFRKVHLGRLEMEQFTPGKKFPVFESHGVKFAVGICWDWHFPELAAIYSLKGAEVLFAPHASPSTAGDRHKIWQQYMGTRAYDNSVYIAACNMCGSDRMGRGYGGGAMVWGPKGEIIAQSLDKSEEILYARLSAQPLNNLRTRERKSMKDSFFLADRKKELYHELLELEVE